MKQLSFLPGEMRPQDRRLIQRALRALERHLHEPGVAFTSPPRRSGVVATAYGST
jgi:DNA repair protein RadC